MAAVTWGELKDRIALRAHKKLGRTDETNDVEYWAKAGIEAVESEDAWPWLRSANTVAIGSPDSGTTYQYAWHDALTRFDARSFRYGGSGSYLAYARRPENIDEILGPHWRTDSDQVGEPKYIVEFGRTFWLAPAPSSAFATSNPTLYYYGWNSDLATIELTATTDSTTLLMPRRAVDTYVCAALKEGLQQEDDPDWRIFESKFRSQIQNLRSFNEVVSGDAEVALPDFTYNMRF